MERCALGFAVAVYRSIGREQGVGRIGVSVRGRGEKAVTEVPARVDMRLDGQRVVEQEAVLWIEDQVVLLSNM